MTDSFFSARERRELVPVEVSIGAPTCGDGREYMSIEVSDKRSGVRFVEVRLSYADMMAALRGRGHLDAEAAIAGLDRVGMDAEYKSVRTFIRLTGYADGYNDRARAAYAAAQPLCVDGWQYNGPSPEDGRHASWRQGDWQPDGNGYTVALRFVRWVPHVENPDGPTTDAGRTDSAAPANPAIRHRRRKPDAP